MKDATKKLKKNGPNAQVAEVQKQNNNAVQPIGSGVEQPGNVADTTESFILFNKPKIDAKKAALLKEFGVDLNSIFEGFDKANAYFGTIEKRFKILAKTNEQLLPLVQFAQQVQTQPQPNPGVAAPTQPENNPGLMGQIGQLAPLLPYILGKGGDSGDDFWKEMGKRSVMADITLSQTLKNVLMSGLVSRQVKPIIDKTLGKE